MATKTWNGLVGAFSSNVGWLPQAAPGTGDTALITAGTVVAVGILPASLVIELSPLNGSQPELALTDGMLVASSKLDIRAGAVLGLRGSIINQGAIIASGGPGIVSIQIGQIRDGNTTKFINTGSISVSGVGLHASTGGNLGNQFENDGSISIRSPDRTSQLAYVATSLAGLGSVSLGNFVTFEAASAVSYGQNFIFEHANSGATTLRIDAGAQFSGVVTGFGEADTVQVVSGRWDAAVYAPTDVNGGVLTMSLGGVVVQTITFKGYYRTSSFRLQETIPFGSSQASTTIAVDDPLFDPAYYRQSNPDVAAAGVDPYQHFIAYGWREGREPSLLFSVSKYLAANPDVQAAGLDPLLHYEAYGRAEGRSAFPNGGTAAADLLVDAAYYDPQIGASLIPTGIAGQQQAAWNYGDTGWRRGLNPDLLFDSTYYLTQNPDVKAAGINPLQHYEQYGWREGRNPSLLFSGAAYLTANPDVQAAALDPLLHYLAYGQREGRIAPLTSDVALVDPLIDTAFYDKQLGATLIPTGTPGRQQAGASYDATGWRRALNPDPFFDTRYYLSHNPDVAAARLNPLQHFEQYGWQEERNPSAQFSTSRYLAAYSDVNAAALNPLEHYLVYGQTEGRTAFAV